MTTITEAADIIAAHATDHLRIRTLMAEGKRTPAFRLAQSRGMALITDTLDGDFTSDAVTDAADTFDRHFGPAAGLELAKAIHRALDAL